MAIHKPLAIGTAQFGMPYGIANQTGQVSLEEAAGILDHAWAAGIDTLDTANGYGNSEQRLGDLGVMRWKVISKLPAVPDSCDGIRDWVAEATSQTLARLRIPKLRGLLLHRPLQLIGPRGSELYAAIVELKEQGLVEKIGISIYDPGELDVLWPRYAFDLVQAPFNVIDRRLATSGWLGRLHAGGAEVHVRSIFLQGLLLLDRAARPAGFDRWRSLFEEWDRWLADQSVAPVAACLGMARAVAEIDRVVVGIDSLQQLRGILTSIDATVAVPPMSLSSDDVALVNPSEWNRR